MFCVQCKVAFSWRSGEQVTRPNAIHNPHYYEWLLHTRGHVPRTAGDDPCAGLGRMPDIWQVTRTASGAKDELLKYHRMAMHVTEVEMRGVRRTMNADDLDLRLAYLVQEMDVDTWRVKLQRREKRREKARAIGQVYEMFYAASVDIFGAFVRKAATYSEAVAQLKALVEYADVSLKNICTRLQMKVRPLSCYAVPY